MRRAEKLTHVLFNVLPNVYGWPLKYRRAFVLLLPISMPLWLLYLAVVSVMAVIALLTLLPIIAIGQLWVGEDDER